jgi:uncharacterized protein (TIGR00251 family)
MIIKVKILPNAKKDELHGEMADGTIKIKIAAPTIEGKANTKLIQFLSDLYGVPKAQIKIIRGLKNSLKQIKISQ